VAGGSRGPRPIPGMQTLRRAGLLQTQYYRLLKITEPEEPDLGHADFSGEERSFPINVAGFSSILGNYVK
jgi:hypothetical protein